MEVLKKITNFVSKYMAVIVIAMAALALLAPNTVSFIKTSYVNTLLGIVMFGMGLTLKPGDFESRIQPSKGRGHRLYRTVYGDAASGLWPYKALSSAG